MKLDKEFYDKLDKINHFRGQKGWTTFFNKIDRLEEMGDEINEQFHFGRGNQLLASAETMAEHLDDEKDSHAGRTVNAEEYDAVIGICQYLKNHFGMNT